MFMIYTITTGVQKYDRALAPRNQNVYVRERDLQRLVAKLVNVCATKKFYALLASKKIFAPCVTI